MTDPSKPSVDGYILRLGTAPVSTLFFGVDRTSKMRPCSRCGWDTSLHFLGSGGSACCCSWECQPLDYDYDENEWLRDYIKSPSPRTCTAAEGVGG